MKKMRAVFIASILMFGLLVPMAVSAAGLLLYYPPEWSNQAPKAKAIAEALSKESGLEIQPRIAQSYPEMITAFSKKEPVLVYVGSFAQTLLYARGLSTPMLQAVDGKEFYTSIMIAPGAAGSDPVAIAKAAGEAVSYSKGASSGESGAKAATEGRAGIATNNHQAAVNAVKAGKAKCAFVKNWWWEDNKGKFEGMKSFEYPGVSDHKNPDNILSANKSVSDKDVAKIKESVLKMAGVFSVKSFT
ncbi:MAG TPA: PhnD/SsuA/transferrin family substrate-binding protein, partial [Thermodesulfobacteriota bacterium]|nr:PhnD/SsuA/transferrin family substrate-binding protein [Thermodesulfobacteriota bacterium]